MDRYLTDTEGFFSFLLNFLLKGIIRQFFWRENNGSEPKAVFQTV